MKGKIDSEGFLKIYRGDPNPSLYQNQVCPFSFTNNGNAKNCGQWCPHFGEPYSHDVIDRKPTGPAKIDICHGKTLIFDEFEVEE